MMQLNQNKDSYKTEGRIYKIRKQQQKKNPSTPWRISQKERALLSESTILSSPPTTPSIYLNHYLINSYTVEYIKFSYNLIGDKLPLINDVNILTVALGISSKYGYYFQMYHPDFPISFHINKVTTQHRVYPLPLVINRFSYH